MKNNSPVKVITIQIVVPDPYEGELNTKRIAEYKKIAKLYNIDESSVRDIFCNGVDWYKSIIDKNNK